MSDFIKQNAIDSSFALNESWVILSEIEQGIKRKIETYGTPLKDWDVSISYGIKTGCNEAFIIDGSIRQKILDNCKDNNERQRTDNIIRPILRGRDIDRDGYKWAGLYLIVMHNGYSKNTGTVVPRININSYPSLKSWFDNGNWNKKESETNIKRLSSRTDKGETPYNLRDCAYMDDFSKQRFIWTAVNSEYRFLAINEEIYYNNSIFHGVSDKAVGISSVMNSGVMRFYMIMLSSDNYQYGGKNLMETIPIPKNIENITYTDEMLRDIYQLTDEEMNFISSSLSPMSE